MLIIFFPSHNLSSFPLCPFENPIFFWIIFFVDFDGYYIVRTDEVNPDRNIFSINVELTSTFGPSPSSNLKVVKMQPRYHQHLFNNILFTTMVHVCIRMYKNCSEIFIRLLCVLSNLFLFYWGVLINKVLILLFKLVNETPGKVKT